MVEQYWYMHLYLQNFLHICRWDREATSQPAEGAPAAWFPSKWPPSGTQPQLHQGGCSSETPREGLVPSRCGWVKLDCWRTPVAEPWSRSSHPPPNLHSCCRHVTQVTRMITGRHMTTTQKPQFSEEDPWRISKIEANTFPHHQKI